MSRISEWYNEEKLKLEGMPVKSRLSYILEYYWLWIAGILLVLVFGIYLTVHIIEGEPEYWIYVALPGAATEQTQQLSSDFAEYMNYDLSEKQEVFNNELYFDPTKATGTNNSYYQMFVTLVEAGTLDGLIMNEAQIQAIGASGRLKDLKREECEELYEKYKDRLVYCEPYDETYETDSNGKVPVGIDISDSILVTEYKLYEDDCVIGIGAYSERIDEMGNFLSFILEDKNE